MAQGEVAEYYRLWVSNLRLIAEAHRSLLDGDAEAVGVGPAEAWDTVMGRIEQALDVIDGIARNGWVE